MTTITDQELLSHTDRLKDKVVLITGAGSGIGQQAAISFAQYGAKIIIGDIDVMGAKHTVRECLKAGGTIGGDALAVKCDVTSWDDQVALFKAGYEKYGRIDYVIPNAGRGNPPDGPLALPGPQRGPPVKPNTSTIDVNIIGVIYTVSLGQYYMMKDKSSDPKALVFIGSISSLIGITKGEIYCTSKHAIIGLCRSLHDSFKPYNIRVATVCPFFVETPILRTSTRVGLAGIPKTPIERVAGAILNAATDPDWSTSGAAYTLPDENEVFRISREELEVGSYKLLHDRVSSLIKIESSVAHYKAVANDLFALIAPHLNYVVFFGPILAYWYFFVRS